MNTYINYLLLLLTWSSAVMAQRAPASIAIEPGVSLELARQRGAAISEIQYQLHFNIPSAINVAIEANEELSFNLSTVPPILQLDFKQSADHVKKIRVNGTSIAVNLQNEHLLIDAEYLRTGSNHIAIQFIAGNESLNRNPDYLYALFVPAHARTAFPCFDQPDLKASFKLSLTVPDDWKVLANGQKVDSLVNNKRNTYHFSNTEKLPTYLFSFTAGKFKELKRSMGRRSMDFLHRETDSNKIKLSIDSIFIAHHEANTFLENWTGIPYPFQKVGFVAIPDFQFGGMEHPGVVHYKSSSLFLGEGSTKDQFISRANLIYHETAHMWFGDLVTMKWFNDVWMKEVFANFIADKVTEELMGKQTFNLKFLQNHYPAAYAIDRTRGANPIRQQLDNLQHAGSMYGNIIYHKAPIMMRQLEQLMGTVNFQKGIQEYLQQYAYKNATWPDLIAILNKHSEANLNEWNKIWVNQPGRPVFDYQIKYKGNKIHKFKIRQQAEMGNKRIWPQNFSIQLIYANHTKNISVHLQEETLNLKGMKGLERPNAILFNADGMGYGLFPVDQALMNEVFKLQDPVARAAVYINAFENVLAGQSFKPAELLQLFTQGLQTEQNEMNLRLLTDYLTNLYWTFSTTAERLAFSPVLEKALWTAMEQQKLPNHKKILFNAYQNSYLSEDAAKTIYRIWEKKQAPEGVKLNEDDYTALALFIALKTDSATTVLQQEAARITNIDRKNRLLFLIPALSSKVEERDSFFNSLKDRKNRGKESWVNAGLAYLHHPLRQHSSINYLPESLELLEEIQKTGDIFFPQSWLSATFGNYQSQEAYQVVSAFLEEHPTYNTNLKDKILQATDNLYRSQTILKQEVN
ncbi:M1 family metallopeptidase [Pedobacter immunditicola]|uniref:M1 family metallopeptidase n=1 Tax=Pedobacter immunditicola TaxID=3133440 RepID=UPI0030A7630C